MIYRTALYDHPLPALANIFIMGPAVQPADTPPSQLATLGLHPIARKLLLIFHFTEGRRLS